jgi:hypothetical protein
MYTLIAMRAIWKWSKCPFEKIDPHKKVSGPVMKIIEESYAEGHFDHFYGPHVQEIIHYCKEN